MRNLLLHSPWASAPEKYREGDIFDMVKVASEAPEPAEAPEPSQVRWTMIFCCCVHSAAHALGGWFPELVGVHVLRRPKLRRDGYFKT